MAAGWTRAGIFRLIADSAIAFLCFVGACLAVVDQPIVWWLDHPLGPTVLAAAAAYAATMAAALAVGKMPHRPWRRVSARDVGRIIRLTAVGAIVFLSLLFLATRGEPLPRSALVIAWVLTTALMAGGRLVCRAMAEGWLWEVLTPVRLRRNDKAREPIVLVGAASRIERALLDIRETDAPYRPVGVIVAKGDEQRASSISGVRVLGDTAHLEGLADIYFKPEQQDAPALVFVDPPRTIEGVDEQVLSTFRRRSVPIFRLPRVNELTEAEQDTIRLRRVRLEELLSRPPVNLRSTRATENVLGKRVLVTGAGGSIGAELCRQIAALGCKRLTLLDIAETPLFEIDRELASNFPSLSRRAVLGDVRDYANLSAIVAEERPDRIFHAAALKHVSLMESHPAAAVLTNLLGTANVARATQEHGVEQMVLISTDKAVNPSSVMGATKRLAEALVHGLSGADRDGARFAVVRFGNVLNSNGSVLPIFRRQIESGGPVTITHPEVERYFMTIPEAVQLLLHAAAVAESREEAEPGVFVLEMGKPVKIVEVAHRMIDLLAPPGRKIEVKLIGLQPGEKLSEELVDADEETVYSDVGVVEVRSRSAIPVTFEEADAFAQFCFSSDPDAVRDRLFSELARVRGKSGSAAPRHLQVVTRDGQRRGA